MNCHKIRQGEALIAGSPIHGGVRSLEHCWSRVLDMFGKRNPIAAPKAGHAPLTRLQESTMRGFEPSEFAARTRRLQTAMAAQGGNSIGLNLSPKRLPKYAHKVDRIKSVNHRHLFKAMGHPNMGRSRHKKSPNFFKPVELTPRAWMHSC